MTDRQKNIARAKAIEAQNKQRILAVCPSATDISGIYVFVRHDDGFHYAYVGQAIKILSRLCSHLKGYQHIDLSIKNHGLYDTEKNPTGWMIALYPCMANVLDEQEQHYIRLYAEQGYQLYNHTTGSQGKGKRALGDAKSPKGYRDGVAQGERNVIKKIAHLFDLHLKAVYKADKPNKNAIKALEKFNQILQGESDND